MAAAPPLRFLHLLSTVTNTSADSESDMDNPVGNDLEPPPSSSLPSPPPKQAVALLAPRSRPMPVREDCWLEEATGTLIGAWGDRYVELNKGNLRQKHWQEVADAVNAVHGHTKKTQRTDIHCKNRIDTIKKKYKVEKAKTVRSRGAYVSPWAFFSCLDILIGYSTANKLSISTPLPAAATSADLICWKSTARSPSRALTRRVPVGPRSLKSKRPAATDAAFIRRNFTAASEGEDGREEPETSRSSGGGSRRRGWKGGSGGGDDDCRLLAEAVMKFGAIYERVEGRKQEQMVQLEKHRMEFTKELDFQRMKLFMDLQLQLAKIKRMKPSSNDADVDADSF